MDKFIVMLEWFDSFEELTNEEKGILFQNFFNHHRGLPVDLNDRVVSVIWKSLLPHIERMNKYYLTKVENGKKGGAPKGRTPWNKKPTPNQEHTESIPTPKQEHSFKEKEKEKEKVKENIKYKEKEITYFSANTETNTNSTHTRVSNFNEFFKPLEVNKKSELIFDNLDDSTRKEANRQAELALEKLLNKNL